MNAIAVASGYSASAMGSAAYTIGGPPPVVNDPSGFASTTSFNLYGTTLVGGALQFTGGMTPIVLAIAVLAVKWLFLRFLHRQRIYLRV